MLLVKAFGRRLSFIVGTSVTTGAINVVVWSGIHHKTNVAGGSSVYGYPDPTYFNRVKLELADRGVTIDSKKEVNDFFKANPLNGSVSV
jgi:deltex-like protein